MKHPDIPAREERQRGAIAILMAFALVGIIGVASFAVDLGMGLVAKSELQNVADAASLAGTRRLAQIYASDPTKIEKSLSGSDQTDVQQRAQTYAALNKAAGISISVPDSDLVLGKYDPKTGALTATTTAVRMLRVTARRDDNANGIIPTTLARAIGINEIGVRASSAVALTPLGTLKSGKGDFPIGISRDWFANNNCNTAGKIVLFPTAQASSCAAWHTFTTSPASATSLKTILTGMLNGTFQSPETIAGQTYYEFIGGNVESRCSDLKDLFDAKKVNGKMTANIPVYDMGCGNANQSRKIIGFARAEITNVICGNNNRKLEVEVRCGIVGEEIGTGGGANDYGFLAGSPSMVQ